MTSIYICQADSEIVKRIVNGDADCIVSGYSDFSMYIGASGPTNIMIRDPKIKANCLLFTNSIILTGQKKRIEWIDSRLHSMAKNYYFPTQPPSLVLDTMEDPLSHSLLAVVMGCDVYPGGIKWFGTTDAMKIKNNVLLLPNIEEKRNKIIDLNLDLEKRKDGELSRASLLCYARAILYELTIDGYIFDKPPTLDSFLDKFSNDDDLITIINDSETLTFPSTHYNEETSKHEFLSCESSKLIEYKRGPTLSRWV